MSSQVQTYTKTVVNQTRVHDYLYDPIHTLSSQRDHARAAFRSHTTTDRIKRVPVAQDMFSELRHHPRFETRLNVVDPVPKSVNRQWPGQSEQRREALIMQYKFTHNPNIQIPHRQYENPDMSKNRYRYFRRPVIPFMQQQIPPDIILASSRGEMAESSYYQSGNMDRAPTPKIRSVYVQTIYRDSDAQTDPFTPEYVVEPNSQPELLTLATLAYGKGLPAGLAEVEMIERARAKRAWEATLPPLHDLNQLDKRRKMMDDQERQEWAQREREIEKLQEERLQVLKTLLQKREKKQQQLQTERLDKLWSKKQMEKEKQFEKDRFEHIRSLRKLNKKRENLENVKKQRCITDDYADFGSTTYAPLTRIGVFPDSGAEQFIVQSKYIDTYSGLLELEASLPECVIRPRVKAPKPQTVTKDGFTKRKYRQERELEEIHTIIKREKEHLSVAKKPLKFLEKIEKPVPRPPTPSVDQPDDGEEEFELAVIELQKLMRGRAIQNMMYEGKEKRMELIKELRSTHALQEAEQQMKKHDKQATIALQRQRKLHDHGENLVDQELNQLESSALGDMLDVLSKELIRLQEERRIHAYAMLAERQRRIREAEESGRRQVEERRRREHDEIFKQTIKVDQDTVDRYLEDVIISSMDLTSSDVARQEIQNMANNINEAAYESEKVRDKLQSQEIVSELVHDFLVPEVRKETIRSDNKKMNRRYLLAAHKQLLQDGDEIITKFVPTPANKQGGGDKDDDSDDDERSRSSSQASSRADILMKDGSINTTESILQESSGILTSKSTSSSPISGGSSVDSVLEEEILSESPLTVETLTYKYEMETAAISGAVGVNNSLEDSMLKKSSLMKSKRNNRISTNTTNINFLENQTSSIRIMQRSLDVNRSMSIYRQSMQTMNYIKSLSNEMTKNVIKKIARFDLDSNTYHQMADDTTWPVGKIMKTRDKEFAVVDEDMDISMKFRENNEIKDRHTNTPLIEEKKLPQSISSITNLHDNLNPYETFRINNSSPLPPLIKSTTRPLQSRCSSPIKQSDFNENLLMNLAQYQTDNLLCEKNPRIEYNKGGRNLSLTDDDMNYEKDRDYDDNNNTKIDNQLLLLLNKDDTSTQLETIQCPPPTPADSDTNLNKKQVDEYYNLTVIENQLRDVLPVPDALDETEMCPRPNSVNENLE